MFFRLMYILLYIPARIFFPTKIVGRKNVPKGKCIIVCNHQTSFDVILLAQSLWRKQYYMAKKELFKNKARGAFIKGIGAFPVDRENVDLKATRFALNVLKQNKTLTMFPQGTRSKGEVNYGNIKTGVCMFAIKEKAPIVPVYIVKKPGIFKFNKIIFGKPFLLNDFYDKKLDKETLEEASKIIVDNMSLLTYNNKKIKKNKN